MQMVTAESLFCRRHDFEFVQSSGRIGKVAAPSQHQRAALPSEVQCSIDDETNQLIATKRMQFDEKAVEEVRMLRIVGNLSDVP